MTEQYSCIEGEEEEEEGVNVHFMNAIEIVVLNDQLSSIHSNLFEYSTASDDDSTPSLTLEGSDWIRLKTSI